MGYSREYLEKLVEAEQKRKDDAAGIQYEYNTEVCPCLFSLAFLCTLYTSVKPIRSPLPYRLHSDAMHVITGG